MNEFYYYIPATQTTWELVNDSPMFCKDDLDAIDQIKDLEGVKRIPPSWKIFIKKDGEFLEVNRRSISRKRMEAKKVG